jgi:DNA mismatch endonuclease (patch repair protein)
MERDKEQNIYLRKNGWKIVRLWEHEIKMDIDKSLKKILNKVK